MFSGNFVNLRSINKKDLEQLRIWRNNPKLRSYFRESTELSKEDQLLWYKNIVLPKSMHLMFAIEDKKNSMLLGACGLCYIDRLRRSSDLSIYIGSQEIYLDEVYAVEAAKILIQYAFNELGLHRVWSEVYSHDLKKQKFFEGLNFCLDGALRETHWTQGRWVDSLFYSLLESEKSKIL